jgi:type II secretory pathway pseudopilin PulG
MQVESAMRVVNNQKGMALLMLVFIVTLLSSLSILRSLDAATIQNDKAKKTQKALAEARLALLAYAGSSSLAPAGCGTNCARPGDLPCPDTNNDGIAENACGNASGSTGQASRLGRLPWRTLGLQDLRDGDGERLWYAVSSRYKRNTRFRPLNSDTVATITLRNTAGIVVNNGAATTGRAALLIAPGAGFRRADGVSQIRSLANQNLAVHYLDNAFGEDNQNFVDANANGFISGPIRDAAGNVLVNDQILGVTRGDITEVMEKRVLAEVRNALTVVPYPSPASFADTTCLGSVQINLPNCAENAALTSGRVPVNTGAGWAATSILRGELSNNWFQLNAWREQVYYAVSPACTPLPAPPMSCLTLNNAQVAPFSAKTLILIAAGPMLAGQVRTTNINKTQQANYLEVENVLPLDDTYIRTSPLSTLINDRAISLP